MDVGATLRNARTRKRLSLEQLSHSTKISVTILDALERNDFDRLPAAIYTRGFLRAYAREVDLDPEETIEQFMKQIEEAPSIMLAPHEHIQVAHPRGGPAGQAAKADPSAAVPSEPRRLVVKIPRVPAPALAAAVVVLAVGAYFGFALRRGEQSSPVTTAEAATNDAVHASNTEPAPDAARAANEVPGALRIELKTTGPCWVSASADRSPVLSRLLQAGEHQAIDAKEEFVLRVGDPSTISILINGTPTRPLGKAGQPVTVQINKDNYKQYLASL